jgi:hypothetical protein
MIVVFPVLVSQAVAPTVIPGMCKAVEKYIAMNERERLINTAKTYNFKLSMKGKNFAIQESDNILSYEESLLLEQGPGEPGNKNSVETDDDVLAKQREAERENEKRERLEKEQRVKYADVKMDDRQAIALEPTYVEIDRYEGGTRVGKELLGIKALPLRVKSNINLGQLMKNEMNIKGYIYPSLIRIGREVIKLAFRLFSKVGNDTLQGDPRKDIIFERSGYKGKGILVLSKAEDIEDNFFNKIADIKKLFKLGWGNIIIADDVAKTAYFCMQQFKGVCNMLPYATIYKNLGQYDVYKDMDDLQRQSSSIFKVGKKHISKIVTDSLVIKKYLKYISEDVDDE